MAERVRRFFSAFCVRFRPNSETEVLKNLRATSWTRLLFYSSGKMALAENIAENEISDSDPMSMSIVGEESSDPNKKELNETENQPGSSASALGSQESVEAPTITLSKRAQKRARAYQERMKRNQQRGRGFRGRGKQKKNQQDDLETFSDKDLTETEYYFENGLRKVYPYYFTFSTYCKARWKGRKLGEVLRAEFRIQEKEVVTAFSTGATTVNGKAADEDYILKDNDFIENVVHRHEQAVSAEPIEIVEETDNVIVINKPASIPVHPCGSYRHNSLLFILAKERGIKGLHSINRLDRLTSGLLAFPKNGEVAAQYLKDIASRKVEKEYVCRVEGEFPDGTVVCEKPLGKFSSKLGLMMVSEDGKEAKTSFEKLSFNGTSSVVKCTPLTGRTHQIRVHLQYLGYPITNDPLYNNTLWGPNKGKGGEYGKTQEKLYADLEDHFNMKQYLVDSRYVDELTMSPKRHQDESTSQDLDVKNNDSICGYSAENNQDYGAVDNPKASDISAQNINLLKGSEIENDGVAMVVEKQSTEKSVVEGNDEVVKNSQKTDTEKSTTSKSGISVQSTERETEILNFGATTLEADCDTNIKAQSTTECDSQDTGNILGIQVEKAKLITDEQQKEDRNTEDTSEPKAKKAKFDHTWTFDPAKMTRDENCVRCNYNFRDPKPHELKLYLHALKYKSPNWAHESPLPDWAAPDWQEENDS